MLVGCPQGEAIGWQTGSWLDEGLGPEPVVSVAADAGGEGPACERGWQLRTEGGAPSPSRRPLPGCPFGLACPPGSWTLRPPALGVLGADCRTGQGPRRPPSWPGLGASPVRAGGECVRAGRWLPRGRFQLQLLVLLGLNRFLSRTVIRAAGLLGRVRAPPGGRVQPQPQPHAGPLRLLCRPGAPVPLPEPRRPRARGGHGHSGNGDGDAQGRGGGCPSQDLAVPGAGGPPAPWRPDPFSTRRPPGVCWARLSGQRGL